MHRQRHCSCWSLTDPFLVALRLKPCQHDLPLAGLRMILPRLWWLWTGIQQMPTPAQLLAALWKRQPPACPHVLAPPVAFLQLPAPPAWPQPPQASVRAPPEPGPAASGAAWLCCPTGWRALAGCRRQNWCCWLWTAGCRPGPPWASRPYLSPTSRCSPTASSEASRLALGLRPERCTVDRVCQAVSECRTRARYGRAQQLV